jgi:predicted benzoate:H+ symporter BenE
MERIIPNSFTELLAGLLLLAALLVALISLIKKEKKQVTKMAAILFVASLCLFSDNGWIYFAGVFIIVTTVTELDFLQNIAAAIRGDKNLFKKKEETKEEIQEKVTSNPTEHLSDL